MRLEYYRLVAFTCLGNVSRSIRGINLSLEIEFMEPQALLIMRVVGDASDPAIIQNVADDYGRALQDPRFKQSMNVVWDIGNVHLVAVSVSLIRQLSVLLRGFSQQRGANYRAALVTNRGADYQLLRIYTSILKLIGQLQIKVFRSMEDAIDWTQQAPSQ